MYFFKNVREQRQEKCLITTGYYHKNWIVLTKNDKKPLYEKLK